VSQGADVLEVASGTGQHAVWFSEHLHVGSWQPSDVDADALRSVAARRRTACGDVIMPVMRLDVRDPHWHLMPKDVVYCANMVHISPWETTVGLLEGAGRVLNEGGRLVLYGPYKTGGHHTAPSNLAFDQSLRSRDADWGIRDLEDVVTEAARHGLHWCRTEPMPANNLVVVFEKCSEPS
jgi:SAM-dependent methyltransferase